MHELSITQSILSIALEHAQASRAKRITRIDLTIGELSNIVKQHVEYYFELLSRDTIAARAVLCFNRPPTRLRCRNCGTVFSPNDLNWSCPGCRKLKVEIVSGQECYISSMEID